MLRSCSYFGLFQGVMGAKWEQTLGAESSQRLPIRTTFLASSLLLCGLGAGTLLAVPSRVVWRLLQGDSGAAAGHQLHRPAALATQELLWSFLSLRTGVGDREPDPERA